ncbi:MAG: putative toxin-antitoxin system toxin component, PIN family [Planctomycetes bacterium]|nr:putative toxin-antitoxin system toxin component, PIN family [Planctomycetota bacterium]
MDVSPPRVVFDCNILFQALISSNGPSHRCFRVASEGRTALFVSEFIFSELREVAVRQELSEKFALDAQRVERFIKEARKVAHCISHVSDAYQHPFDPKDSHYINLALAANAKLVVSRDNHLLMLNNAVRPEGRDFQQRFPDLRILDPSRFLKELDRTP